MSEIAIDLDDERIARLQAVVDAGLAASVQEAFECAIDAWLAEQALSKLSDEELQRLWCEGIESGDAGEL